MNHQPYKTWILDDNLNLQKEQTSELQEHLVICQECRDLSTNWQELEEILLDPPVKTAPDGFSLRWKQKLTERQIARQQAQIRKVFFFLIFGIAVTGIVLSLILIETSSLSNFFILFLKGMTDIFVSLTKINLILRPIINDLPVFIPVTIWILFSTTLCSLVLIWIAAIWKFAFQGVTGK